MDTSENIIEVNKENMVEPEGMDRDVVLKNLIELINEVYIDNLHYK